MSTSRLSGGGVKKFNDNKYLEINVFRDFFREWRRALNIDKLERSWGVQ